MKRFSAFLLALFMVAILCTTVFAAGINSAEQSVLQNMRTPANMKGNMVYVPVAYINQAEAHFNTIDMTSEQADKINGIINEGRSFLENTGKGSIKDLSASQKRTLLAYASAAADVLKLTAAAFSDDTRIKITTKDGAVVMDESDNIIKTTGFSSIAVPITMGVSLLITFAAASIGVIIIKKREPANEKN